MRFLHVAVIRDSLTPPQESVALETGRFKKKKLKILSLLSCVNNSGVCNGGVGIYIYL